MIRYSRYLTLILLAFFAFSLPALAGTVYSNFTDACTSAFAKSTPGTDEAAKMICGCTAKESRHQGVTAAELKKETQKIRKDPKYKIENKKLLAAFHVCTISAMGGVHDEDSQ